MLSFADIPDESLMDFIRAGNVRAFEALVERHQLRFYHMCYRWLLNKEDAEDTVQHAFIKLWSGQAKWKSGKNARFTTWFYRILYNQSVDALRKRRYQMSELHENIASDDTSAESALIASQQQQRLRSQLAELPEQQRIAINLFYFEQMKQKDIAQAMGLSVKAVESHLSRAKAALRERLDTPTTHEVSYG